MKTYLIENRFTLDPVNKLLTDQRGKTVVGTYEAQTLTQLVEARDAGDGTIGPIPKYSTQIYTLRKLLGVKSIETVRGLGYRFVGSLILRESSKAKPKITGDIPCEFPGCTAAFASESSLRGHQNIRHHRPIDALGVDLNRVAIEEQEPFRPATPQYNSTEDFLAAALQRLKVRRVQLGEQLSKLAALKLEDSQLAEEERNVIQSLENIKRIKHAEGAGDEVTAHLHERALEAAGH